VAAKTGHGRDDWFFIGQRRGRISVRVSWGEQSGGDAKPGAALWFSFAGMDVSRGQRGGGPWRVVARGGEARGKNGSG